MTHGSCLCGDVKFSLAIDPDVNVTSTRTDKNGQTSLCHCRACRKITGGTTSVNLTVPSTHFVLDSGTLKTVTTRHVDEGFEFSLSFCEGCGSPIYAVPQARPGVKIIQVGVLDDGDLLDKTPDVELNVKYRPAWVQQVSGAEQRERYT
ncbi:hypothetical protein PV05_08621 [Exophiala xenobiotica]|uniref:CENP-V/GFA domain-containing protein n=1 Tax=Exophiala xenobiotica TaxID=348802 RepID=A0A0D2BKL6_9EURO|nr:uncharacterized protein PV05_08621 [Exophiala xenobiotica]KIW53016.1 hypothetical protein PV05_08621 [Exophiala xenobiotica]